MRIRGFVVVACSVLVTLGTAACDGSTGTTPTTPTTSESRTTTARPRPGAPADAASFRADLTIQHAGLGLLALTDVTRRSIAVRGWPALVFYNAANESLAVPTKNVAVPGAGPSITIGPGETAFAGVRWVTGGKADPKTFVATSVRLTPPGYGGSINVRVVGAGGQSGGDVEFDMTSVQIGTLQPSSQGVLVF